MEIRYGAYDSFFIGQDDERCGVFWAYISYMTDTAAFEDFLDWLDTVPTRFFFQSSEGWVVWQFADRDGPFYLKMFYHEQLLDPVYDFPWGPWYHYDYPEDGDPWDHDIDHYHHRARSNGFSPMTCPTSRPRAKGKPSKWDRSR